MSEMNDLPPLDDETRELITFILSEQLENALQSRDTQEPKESDFVDFAHSQPEAANAAGALIPDTAAPLISDGARAKDT